MWTQVVEWSQTKGVYLKQWPPDNLKGAYTFDNVLGMCLIHIYTIRLTKK